MKKTAKLIGELALLAAGVFVIVEYFVFHQKDAQFYINFAAVLWLIGLCYSPIFFTDNQQKDLSCKSIHRHYYQKQGEKDGQ